MIVCDLDALGERKLLQIGTKLPTSDANDAPLLADRKVDVYFSADVETDGPIPGPYSLLSFALVYAGSFDGKQFVRPSQYDKWFYRELKPISDLYQLEALAVNELDRDRLLVQGDNPRDAMNDANNWIKACAGGATPILVAYPLSFDWAWLYWYFIQYADEGSPFEYSRCYDLKTAIAVKSRSTISQASRSKLHRELQSFRMHTHHALDDAVEQADIFGKVFEWEGQP